MKKTSAALTLSVFSGILFTVAGISSAAVNVDINTPNASVHVGTPSPPPPRVTVIERERAVVKERHYEGRKDNGKHLGQKKHKKHKKDLRNE